MDLFSLMARISLDTDGFKIGLKDAKQSMSETTHFILGLADDAGSKGAKGFKAIAHAQDEVVTATQDLGKRLGEAGEAVSAIGEEAEKTADSMHEVKEETENVGESTEKEIPKSKRHWWQLGEAVEKTGSKVKASTIMLGNWMFEMSKSALRFMTDVPKIGLTYNMQMEDYTTNFRVMLGSMEAAEEKVEELKSMAAKTPFAMEDLADATQTLLAFGVASEKTTSVMSRLGDISLGNAQRMSSLSNAYGKAAAQGKLTGEVVQMMVDAGFNPLLQISDATGESMETLQKRMSAGAVSVDELDLALRRATSEGGQFYRGMEEASKTLSGQLSTLEDNWNALLGEAMSPVNEQLSSKVMPAAISGLDRLSAALFGVEEDAESAKKALFFDPEGNPTDPQKNLLTWVDDLMTKWTDGETEDTATVQSFVDTFKQNTNTIKDALVARIEDMSNPMTEEEIQEAQLKIAEIGRMQTRVEELLQKRAGGYITAEEETELNRIIETLKTMQTELEAAAAFDDNIVSPWERLVESAGNLAADGIDKLADFFEWCAGDGGETASTILKGIVISFATISGLKAGGLVGALLAGGTTTIVVNLGKIASAAEKAAKKLDALLEKLARLLGVETGSIQDAYADGLGETWDVDENTGLIYFINEDGSRSYGKNRATGSGVSGGGSYGPTAGGRPTDANATVHKRAVGLDYVPYNEFPALLHEGEAVLTKLEAQQWRHGDDPGTNADVNRLVSAVQDLIIAVRENPVTLNVDGRSFAVATAGDNTRAMNARQNDINIGRVRF